MSKAIDDCLILDLSDRDLNELKYIIDHLKHQDGTNDKRFQSFYFEFPNNEKVNDIFEMHSIQQDVKFPLFTIKYLRKPNYFFKISNFNYIDSNPGSRHIKFNPTVSGVGGVAQRSSNWDEIKNQFESWLKQIQYELDLLESENNHTAGNSLNEDGTINCDSNEPLRPVEKNAVIERLDIIISMMRNQDGLTSEEKEIGIDTANEIMETAKSDIPKKDLIDTVPSKFSRIVKKQVERAGDKVSDEGIKMVWNLLKGGLVTILASPTIQAQLGPVAPFLAAYIATSSTKQITEKSTNDN
ncbi:MAG: hypothetical protein IPO63_08490 [Bacteroidetes bacterium]|nr:hypothetical protein [Bacteroidota bacterium]